MGKTIVKQEIFKNISYEVEFPFEKFFITLFLIPLTLYLNHDE